MSLRHKLNLDRVIALLLQNKTYTEIATIMTAESGRKVSRSAISGIVRDLKTGKLVSSVHAGSYIYGVDPDEGGIPTFTGEMEVMGDVLVIADVHVPFTDWGFFSKIVPVGKHLGLKTLIIAGDFLDLESQSRFDSLVPPVPLQVELEFARKALRELAEWFTDIYYIRGNHEDRMMKKMDGELTFYDLAKMIQPDNLPSSNFHVSPYDRIFLTSGEERWGIFHQNGTSSANKLKVAEGLAWKFQTNVVITHQHKNAVATDKYNNFALASLGGIHSPERQAYVQLKSSASPNQEQGFASIVRGRIQLWTPDQRITDWSQVKDL